jgi:probable rRNA maturation factor
MTEIIVNLVKTNKQWQFFVKEQHLNRRLFIADTKAKITQIIDFTPLKSSIFQSYIFEFNFYLINDKEMSKINLNFRGKDSPTNVIAFPFLSEENIRKKGLVRAVQEVGKYVFLGEIFLSYGKIYEEAEESNKIFSNHLIHLITHGILHLLGYDHIKKKDAEVMENLEIEILQHFDIKNPYSD